ncbi:MAG TPA: hypothetical protein VN732_08400 [Solirubrobacterales bacterium]|nr:hypothetical protein [Solirubrobacterales bacterium]
MVAQIRIRWLVCLAVLVLCLLLGSAVPVSARLTMGNGIALQTGEAGVASSVCPTGLEARQGGFSADFGAEGGAEVTGFKMRGRGWRVLATNTGSEAAGVSVESYCSPAAPHGLVQRSATVEVPAGGNALAVARCRGDETLLSAGFRNSIELGRAHVVVDGMQRIGVRNLGVSGANLSTRVRGRLTAYAYCGHGKYPLVRSETLTVPPSSKERLVARCPEKVRGFGYRPGLFGGFQAGSSDPLAGAVVSPAQYRSFGDRQVLTAVNRSADQSIQMTVFVYCR